MEELLASGEITAVIYDDQDRIIIQQGPVEEDRFFVSPMVFDLPHKEWTVFIEMLNDLIKRHRGIDILGGGG